MSSYEDWQLKIPTARKAVFKMINWWIEEDYSPVEWNIKYDRLRGQIEGRTRFHGGEPVFHHEHTYTSAILRVEGDRLETVNSIYILGEPKDE